MRGCSRGRRGASLLEVVVAVTVLEVGLLGVAGLVTLAARDLGAARRIDGAVAALSEVVDSLEWSGVAGPGRRSGPGGSVRWRTSPGPESGLVRLDLEAVGRDGRRVFGVRTLLPVGPAVSPGPGP